MKSCSRLRTMRCRQIRRKMRKGQTAAAKCQVSKCRSVCRLLDSGINFPPHILLSPLISYSQYPLSSLSLHTTLLKQTRHYSFLQNSKWRLWPSSSPPPSWPERRSHSRWRPTPCPTLASDGATSSPSTPLSTSPLPSSPISPSYFSLLQVAFVSILILSFNKPIPPPLPASSLTGNCCDRTR